MHQYRTSKKEKRKMARNTSVMGIYPDRTTVSDAVTILKRSGYRPMDVSVLQSDNSGTKDFAHEKHTKALQGAGTGALFGAVIGAILAWFLSTQPTTFAGLAWLGTTGPILAALAGAGAGGAIGWTVGLLVGLSGTEYVAKRYAGRIRRGGILISVHCDSPEWRDRAMKTLKDTGARDISCSPETAADFGTTDKPTEKAPALAPIRVETNAPPVVEYVPVEIKE
jgi:hypothetical protein